MTRMSEQNRRLGQESFPKKPQQTAFCSCFAPSIKRAVSSFFCSCLHLSLFLTTSSHISFFLSCWAGVLNEVTTRAVWGCASECCLKRAFLSFPLIFYPLNHPISFTLTFPPPYPSPPPLLLLMCSHSLLKVKQKGPRFCAIRIHLHLPVYLLVHLFLILLST